MPKSLEINLRNESGRPDNYVLFNQKPECVGGDGARIYINVFASSEVGPGDTACFNFSDEYTAIAGSSHGGLREGVNVNVSQSIPVSLGGNVKLVVQENRGVLSLVPESSANAPLGSFGINTDNFDGNKAAQGNWITGLGIRTPDVVPSAVFCPEPGRKYQLRPSSTWYIARSNQRRGTIIEPEMVRGFPIDTKQFQNGELTVVHNEQGRFEVQR